MNLTRMPMESASDSPISLNENDNVTFEIGEGKKGPCAIKVSKN